MREETFGELTVRITGGTDRKGGGEGPLVVLLHGFGAPGDDLVSLWRVIDAPQGTRFLFPEAPMELGREYGDGRAWWWVDVAANQLAAMRGTPQDRTNEVPEGMAEARAMLEAMLDEANAALTPSHLILGGFSQGAMLSCDVTLRSDRKIDGLLQLSGTLLAQHEWGTRMAARRGLPVLQSHGDVDTLLPYDAAEKLRDLLKEAGLDVRWIPFHGGHEIPQKVVDGIGRLLRDVVSRAA
jgi:phospholipase/carboxylesterase